MPGILGECENCNKQYGSNIFHPVVIMVLVPVSFSAGIDGQTGKRMQAGAK